MGGGGGGLGPVPGTRETRYSLSSYHNRDFALRARILKRVIFRIYQSVLRGQFLHLGFKRIIFFLAKDDASPKRKTLGEKGSVEKRTGLTLETSDKSRAKTDMSWVGGVPQTKDNAQAD